MGQLDWRLPYRRRYDFGCVWVNYVADRYQAGQPSSSSWNAGIVSFGKCLLFVRAIDVQRHPKGLIEVAVSTQNPCSVCSGS